MAADRLDDDEKIKVDLDALQPTVNKGVSNADGNKINGLDASAINESGLYSLILTIRIIDRDASRGSSARMWLRSLDMRSQRTLSARTARGRQNTAAIALSGPAGNGTASAAWPPTEGVTIMVIPSLNTGCASIFLHLAREIDGAGIDRFPHRNSRNCRQRLAPRHRPLPANKSPPLLLMLAWLARRRGSVPSSPPRSSDVSSSFQAL